MLKIHKNTALKQQNTFRIGGKCQYFTQVTNKQQLQEALLWADKQSVPFFILGGGSNVLFPDNVYHGLIIRIANDRIKKIEKNNIIVGAGMPLPELERLFLQHNWTGLEWSNKIPGTVGGAVYGNAGAFGKEMKNLVKKVVTINPCTLKEKNYSLSQCRFSYRKSIFKTNHEIIWEVVLKTQKGKKKLIQEKRQAYREYKVKEQHLFKYPSAGSIFKNILIKDTPYAKSYHKYPQSIEGQAFIKGEKVLIKGGKLSAGWLIEQCGLKGNKKGGAMISEFHANVIVNSGRAKAKDVLYLIDLCKKKVWKKFKISLEEEIIVIHY